MKINKCKGLRFRAFQNYHSNKGRIEEKTGFNLLKRQSCMGCDECGGLWDHVEEVLRDYDSLPIKGDKSIDVHQDYSVNISGYDGEYIEFYPVGERVYK